MVNLGSNIFRSTFKHNSILNFFLIKSEEKITHFLVADLKGMEDRGLAVFMA